MGEKEVSSTSNTHGSDHDQRQSVGSGNGGQLDKKIEGEKKQGKALIILKFSHQQLKLDHQWWSWSYKRKEQKELEVNTSASVIIDGGSLELFNEKSINAYGFP